MCINDIDKLDSGEPFSVIRIDNTAGHVIDCRLRGEYPSGEHYHERSLVEGGIHPHTVDYAYNYVIPPTIEALADAGKIAVTTLSVSAKSTLKIFADAEARTTEA